MRRHRRPRRRHRHPRRRQRRTRRRWRRQCSLRQRRRPGKRVHDGSRLTQRRLLLRQSRLLLRQSRVLLVHALPLQDLAHDFDHARFDSWRRGAHRRSQLYRVGGLLRQTSRDLERVPSRLSLVRFGLLDHQSRLQNRRLIGTMRNVGPLRREPRIRRELERLEARFRLRAPRARRPTLLRRCGFGRDGRLRARAIGAAPVVDVQLQRASTCTSTEGNVVQLLSANEEPHPVMDRGPPQHRPIRS